MAGDTQFSRAVVGVLMTMVEVQLVSWYNTKWRACKGWVPRAYRQKCCPCYVQDGSKRWQLGGGTATYYWCRGSWELCTVRCAMSESATCPQAEHHSASSLDIHIQTYPRIIAQGVQKASCKTVVVVVSIHNIYPKKETRRKWHRRKQCLNDTTIFATATLGFDWAPVLYLLCPPALWLKPSNKGQYTWSLFQYIPKYCHVIARLPASGYV